MQIEQLFTDQSDRTVIVISMRSREGYEDTIGESIIVNARWLALAKLLVSQNDLGDLRLVEVESGDYGMMQTGPVSAWGTPKLRYRQKYKLYLEEAA